MPGPKRLMNLVPMQERMTLLNSALFCTSTFRATRSQYSHTFCRAE